MDKEIDTLLKLSLADKPIYGSDGRLSDFHRRLLPVNKIMIIMIITYVCIAIKITIILCM